jgi:hypothetical protein
LLCKAILDRHLDAHTALQEVLDGYVVLFSHIQDEYLKERLADIRDVIGRVKAQLAFQQNRPPIALREPVVVNCAFGGPDLRTLYVTCGKLLLSLVLTQYKSLSLERHISQGWLRFFSAMVATAYVTRAPMGPSRVNFRVGTLSTKQRVSSR